MNRVNRRMLICGLRLSVFVLMLNLFFVGNLVGQATVHASSDRQDAGNEYALAKARDAAKAVIRIKEKIAVLDGLMEEAERQGKGVADQKVSRTVAAVFAEYIQKDAERDVESYRKWESLLKDSFKILGQEETLRRIDQLGGFESKTTEEILERAIKECRQVLNDPNAGKKSAVLPVGMVMIKSGAFYSDNKPVFLRGIQFGPTTIEGGESQRNLGANLAGWYMHLGIRTGGILPPPTNIFQIYKNAEAAGLLYSPLVYPQGVEKQIIEKHSDIVDEKKWFRRKTFADIDHPQSGSYIKNVCSNDVSLVAGYSNNFCYNIFGEEYCSGDYRSKYTGGRYAVWLKDKYSDIKELNALWGSAYKDFNEAAADTGLKTKGAVYSWYTFNQHRLTTFNQWIIDGLRQGDPKMDLYACWPQAGSYTAPMGWLSRKGVNWEDIINQETVVGWDGMLLPEESVESRSIHPEQRQKYNMYWRDELIYYDFARSVAPDKPIYDPEWHLITSTGHSSSLGISSDYIRAALWLDHLHGMGAHLLWWWGRRTGCYFWGGIENPAGVLRSGGEAPFGGLMTQPQLLEGWGRTVLELQRLAEYVVLFPTLERRVRIFYSEPSAIQEGGDYTTQLSEVYEGLFFQDYPVGFVTEKMIREGKLNECSLLVIPDARYVSDSAVKGIREYQRRGGKTAIVGKKSLVYDEYGRKREIDDIQKNSVYLEGTMACDYEKQLDRLIDEAGIDRPIRMKGRGGERVSGVEMRVARKDGKKIISLINLNRGEVEIEFQKRDVGWRIWDRLFPRRVNDLITGKTVELGRPISLLPRKIMLLEVD